MGDYTVINLRNERCVAEHVIDASTWWRRLSGLLGSAQLASNHGLWLRPCVNIHTLGMRFPIDVVFLDGGNSIVKLVHRLMPYRIACGGKGTLTTLELGPGVIAHTGLREGDQLRFLHGPR